MCRERPDVDRVTVDRDPAELRNPTDVDDGVRHRKTELEQGDEAVASGEDLGTGMLLEEVSGFCDGTGAVVVEVSGIHRSAPFRFLDGAPYPLRCKRHVERLDPERSERIHHRVVDRHRRRNRSGLADPLHAQRMVR